MVEEFFKPAINHSASLHIKLYYWKSSASSACLVRHCFCVDLTFFNSDLSWASWEASSVFLLLWPFAVKWWESKVPLVLFNLLWDLLRSVIFEEIELALTSKCALVIYHHNRWEGKKLVLTPLVHNQGNDAKGATAPTCPV